MSDTSAHTAARRQIERAMRVIVSRDRPPYRAGWRIYATAFSHATGPEEIMWPMWLLWGGLTDWVEVKPEETEEAESTMRRAAREWLSLRDDPAARHAYFDRWLYDEMGYERPRQSDPASGPKPGGGRQP